MITEYWYVKSNYCSKPQIITILGDSLFKTKLLPSPTCPFPHAFILLLPLILYLYFPSLNPSSFLKDCFPIHLVNWTSAHSPIPHEISAWGGHTLFLTLHYHFQTNDVPSKLEKHHSLKLGQPQKWNCFPHCHL